MGCKKDKPLKALVTGGGGFLGGAVVKRLVEKSYSVRSLSRNFYQKLHNLGVEQITGDISDKDTADKACEGVDLVFHTAAKTGVWGKYQEYYNTNVAGTENIISACIRHNIERLVYTSSPSVIFDGSNMEGVDESVGYPDSYHSHYSKTKACAEQAVLTAAKKGLKTIILRPHLIWGPEDTNLVPRIIARAKRLRRIGDGKNLVDTVYIDNAAEAHILAAEKLEKNKNLSGKIYFISQGQPVYLWDMIDNILKAANLPPVKGSVPKKAAWIAGAVFEIICKAFNIKKEPFMTRFVANELSTSHWFDISAARKDLGYNPEVSVEEGLLRLQEWLDRNGV